MIPAIADPSGDISSEWGWGVWLLMIAVGCAIGLVLHALNHPIPNLPLDDTTPADAQLVPRARTAPPALRVYHCTRLCGRDVARPGESCYPVCESPVHAAERILRATEGGAA